MELSLPWTVAGQVFLIVNEDGSKEAGPWGRGKCPKTKWHTAYSTSSAYIWQGLKSQWHFTPYSTHKLISPYQQRVVGRIKVCLRRLAVSARLSQCKGGEWMWTGNVCAVWTGRARWVWRRAGNSWTCPTGWDLPGNLCLWCGGVRRGVSLSPPTSQTPVVSGAYGHISGSCPGVHRSPGNRSSERRKKKRKRRKAETPSLSSWIRKYSKLGCQQEPK